MRNLEEKIVKGVLCQEAFKQFQQGDIAKKYLEKPATLIKQLSEGYVHNKRDLILKNMSDPEMSSAYALYYLPINFFKIRSILAEIDLPKRSELRVLDYGAGPGTATLALLGSHDNLKATLFDKSEQMLSVAKKLLNKERLALEYATSLSGVIAKRYDVVVLSNALNEFSVDEEEAFLNRIDNLLDQNGVLIILETALKSAARNLQFFRAKVLERYGYNILFPCTHCNECKMLLEVDNWCHGVLEGLDSQLVRQIDQITGYNKHRIKYAALVFQKGEVLQKVNHFRVVDVPLKDKKGISLKLCGVDTFGFKQFGKHDTAADGAKIKKVKLFDKIELLPSNNVS
ncbi:MAG: small ribosomal subunit Rsm22 family protein [Bdellovibrionota bacterium]|jgi:2-polyprenyl-3-methyl-5-hydroxy-6-metoxy-1,4-benzoquinol methylase